jgi:DNA-binding NarL/FixJ family response regulator
MDLRHRIIIVDDHPLLRMGVRQLLHNEPDLLIAGEADHADQVEGLVEALDPDLLVLDLNLGEVSGLAVLRSLRSRWPHLKCLVLTLHEARLHAHACLRAGANGYLTKDAAATHLNLAIREVLLGRRLVLDRQGRWDDERIGSGPASGLSPREQDVMRLLGQGQPVRTIAATLQMSVKTVETHQAGLKRKLNCASAGELLRLAIAWRDHFAEPH